MRATYSSIRRDLYICDALHVAETLAIDLGLTLEQLLTTSAPEARDWLWHRLSVHGLSQRAIAKIWHVGIARVARGIEEHLERMSEVIRSAVTEAYAKGAAPSGSHLLNIDGFIVEIEEADHAS